MANKNVLITGCNRGIGLALAKEFVQRGWNLIAAVRHPSSVQNLQELNPLRIVQIDVSDEVSISVAGRELQDIPIHLVVNNSGVFCSDGLEDVTKAEMMRHYEINVVGPFLVSRALLPSLELAVKSNQNGFAVIAHMGSGMGSITKNTTSTSYPCRASKAAVSMLGKSLSIDLKDRNIASIVVSPGFVATGMNTLDLTDAITPEASASGLVQVLEKAGMNESGKFIQYDGEELPW